MTIITIRVPTVIVNVLRPVWRVVYPVLCFIIAVTIVFVFLFLGMV